MGSMMTRRVTLIIEAYDRNSFTQAMHAAVALANQQDGPTVRVELRVGRPVAEWSIVLLQVCYSHLSDSVDSTRS